MILAISASSDDRPIKVLEKYPSLSNYNYKLGEDPGPDHFRRAYIEVNSLGEVIMLMEELGEPIIMSIDNRHGYDQFELEIYDCCRED